MGSDYFATKAGETPLRDVRNSLLDGGDQFFVLADFADYVAAQRNVETAFRDRHGWAKKAILNVARSGKFSSDRAIKDYAKKIWNLCPADVK
jgi:starch phosphorylase